MLKFSEIRFPDYVYFLRAPSATERATRSNANNGPVYTILDNDGAVQCTVVANHAYIRDNLLDVGCMTLWVQ